MSKGVKKSKVYVGKIKEVDRQYCGMIISDFVTILENVTNTQNINGVVHIRSKIEAARTIYARDISNHNPSLYALVKTISTGRNLAERELLALDEKLTKKESSQ